VDATPSELKSLAKAVHALLPFMRAKKFSYNFYFHDAVGQTDECFEIRFSPRVNVFGGFELDTDIVVNPVTAEEAAAAYREAGA